MSEISNIRGEFKIELAGKERAMRATFEAIERLEGGLLRKTIVETLSDMGRGIVRVGELASVIHTGLACNKDTRLTRSEIGEELVRDGIAKHLPTVINYLSYLITGGQEAKGGEPGESEAAHAIP
jgi:hypothetical protein